MLPAGEALWLGLYQSGPGPDPISGWKHCVAGDAPSFSNWLESRTEPNDL